MMKTATYRVLTRTHLTRVIVAIVAIVLVADMLGSARASAATVKAPASAATVKAPASATIGKAPAAPAAATSTVTKVTQHFKVPAGNRLARPVKVGPTGLTARVDARHATAESKDPTPSCLAGKRAAGTVWYRLAAAPTGRLLDVSVSSRSRAVVVAAFAIVPWAGTELTCLKAGSGATVHLRHVLAPNLRYYVMVASADTTVGDMHTVKIRAGVDRWSATTPIQARRQGVAAAADGTSVYTFGGFQTSTVVGGPDPFHSADISRFDMRTRSWSVVGQLPVGLSYARAVRLGGTIFLPGGKSNLENGTNCIVKKQFAFDIATNVVTTVSEQPGYYTYDYGADADAARGIYYMAGGAYDPTPCDTGAAVDDTTVSNFVKSYNPATDKWTTLPPMPTARRGAATVVADGWLFVIGGLDAGNHALRTVETFNPATGQWYSATPLPVATYGAAAGLGIDHSGRGVITVAGGWSNSLGDIDLTQVYDVNTNNWRQASTHLTARDSIGSTVFGNVLWAIGGFATQPLRATEVLNFAGV